MSLSVFLAFYQKLSANSDIWETCSRLSLVNWIDAVQVRCAAFLMIWILLKLAGRLSSHHYHHQ